jgi:DNA mismatch repair ATPase MutS
VRTLIVGADSITEGKSYYLAEVLAALERLQAVGEDGKHLVLVDEPFRGTNTEERIGAGKAYLEALVRRGALTLAASHDRQLGSLLVETFRLMHFTERIEGQEILFDYTLREGASRTRNAIRILEIAGFSSELVAEARRVAQSLAEGSRGYPAHG